MYVCAIYRNCLCTCLQGCRMWREQEQASKIHQHGMKSSAFIQRAQKRICPSASGLCVCVCVGAGKMNDACGSSVCCTNTHLHTACLHLVAGLNTRRAKSQNVCAFVLATPTELVCCMWCVWPVGVCVVCTVSVCVCGTQALGESAVWHVSTDEWTAWKETSFCCCIGLGYLTECAQCGKSVANWNRQLHYMPTNLKLFSIEYFSPTFNVHKFTLNFFCHLFGFCV